MGIHGLSENAARKRLVLVVVAGNRRVGNSGGFEPRAQIAMHVRIAVVRNVAGVQDEVGPRLYGGDLIERPDEGCVCVVPALGNHARSLDVTVGDLCNQHGAPPAISDLVGRHRESFRSPPVCSR